MFVETKGLKSMTKLALWQHARRDGEVATGLKQFIG